MLRKLKRQIPGENTAARYNWCQGPVPGRGPAVEKHWFREVSTGTFCLQRRLQELQQNASRILCNVSPNKAKCRNFDTVFYKFLTDEY